MKFDSFVMVIHLQWLDTYSSNAAIAQHTVENSILRLSLEAVASYVELVSKNMFSIEKERVWMEIPTT